MQRIKTVVHPVSRKPIRIESQVIPTMPNQFAVPNSVNHISIAATQNSCPGKSQTICFTIKLRACMPVLYQDNNQKTCTSAIPTKLFVVDLGDSKFTNSLEEDIYF